MSFLEENLEEIIFANRYIIHKKGFLHMGSVNLRQFRLPSGKRIDILSCYTGGESLHFNIIELKRDIIDDAALIQSLSYLSEFIKLFSMFTPATFSVTLVGRKLYPLSFLDTISEKYSVELYSYDYGINGIEFFKVKMPDLKPEKYFDYFNCISAIEFKLIEENENFQNSFLKYLKDCPNAIGVLKICRALNKPIDQAFEIMKSIKGDDNIPIQVENELILSKSDLN